VGTTLSGQYKRTKATCCLIFCCLSHWNLRMYMLSVISSSWIVRSDVSINLGANCCCFQSICTVTQLTQPLWMNVNSWHDHNTGDCVYPCSQTVWPIVGNKGDSFQLISWSWPSDTINWTQGQSVKLSHHDRTCYFETLIGDLTRILTHDLHPAVYNAIQHSSGSNYLVQFPISCLQHTCIAYPTSC